MNTFSTLSIQSQVHRLRQKAEELLGRYALSPKRLTLLSHGFNTVFRVDTKKTKFALRMNVNSKRTPENTRAELAWLQALSRDTDLSVPKPVLSKQNTLLEFTQLEGLGPIPCVLFEWMVGGDLEERLSVSRVEQMGRISATLHHHAQTFKLPTGAALTTADDILYGLPNVLFGQPDPRLNSAQTKLFAKAYEVAQNQLEAVFAQSNPPRLLHADLHEGNFKSYRGRVSVFDFDDSVLGHPVQDVATTFYHLATEDEYAEYRAAYVRGYTTVLPWEFEDSTLETLMAGRGLLLLNDVLLSANPEMQAVAPSFAERIYKRLDKFLQIGVWKA